MPVLATIRRDKIPAGMKVETLYTPGIEESSHKALIAQGKDSSKLHLIVDMSRIGAGLFNVKIEYTYFPPRSGRNYLYEMTLMRWPDNQYGVWAVSSFPIEFKPQAEAIAKECGLRIANGIPTIFEEGVALQFPMDGSTVFTLENIKGHQVYGNNSADYERLKAEEKRAIDAIIGSDRLKLAKEFLAKGYDPVQIERIISRWEHGDESYDEPPSNAKANDGQHRHKSPL